MLNSHNKYGHNTVGVVVTGFYCDHYLVDALNSLLLQRDHDWECAVLFDPTENGHAVEAFTHIDSRFKLIPSPPLNVCVARNLGFSSIAGDLLFALDGDDLITPDYIKTLRSLMARSQVAIAYTGTQYFGDIHGVKQELPYSPRLLAVRNTIVSSAMMRRVDFEAVGGYDEKLSIGYEDWDLWISILKRGGEVAFDSEPHFLYRQRPNSRTQNMTYTGERVAKEHIFHKHADFCWHSGQ